MMHAPIAIWTTDIDGVITMSEGAGLAALGVKSGQLVGQKVLDIYGAHPTIPGYIRRGLAGRFFLVHGRVGEAVYHTWLTPLRGPAGEIVGLTGLSHDISELHRLQQTTIQNDRVMALGTLAASVAHEINNPLAYVLAQAEGVDAEVDALEGLLAKMHGPEVPAARASLARLREGLAPVRSGTARIASITRDLRTFSRPEDSSLYPVDLRGVVLSVLKLVGKEIEARARLVLDLQPDAPGDGQRGAPRSGRVEPGGQRDAGPARRFNRGPTGPPAHQRRRSAGPARGLRLRARGAGGGSGPNLRAVLLDEGDRQGDRAWAVRLPQHRAGARGRCRGARTGRRGARCSG